MRAINVEIPGFEYNVITGIGALNSLNGFMEQNYNLNKILFVIDNNVLKLHREYLLANLPGINDTNFLGIDVSENLKSLDTVQKIYSKLIAMGAGRDAVLVGVGGGITGDITGFAAASFMRGIDYVQIPTTLLAAVDSSVGGKTGVNFNGIKNIIGAFYQPEIVVADHTFFNSLPIDELVCGLGEIVKYGFLAGGEYYKRLSDEYINILALKDESLEYFIEESVSYKSNIVAEDEKEAGLRKILNLGHTFAHGLETALDFKLKHGQAVICGISCALELSGELGIINSSDYNNSKLFLSNFREYINLEFPDIDTMLEVMSRDKKNREGKIKFVLPVKPGEVALDVEANNSQIVSAINKGMEIFIA